MNGWKIFENEKEVLLAWTTGLVDQGVVLTTASHVADQFLGIPSAGNEDPTSLRIEPLASPPPSDPDFEHNGIQFWDASKFERGSN